MFDQETRCWPEAVFCLSASRKPNAILFTNCHPHHPWIRPQCIITTLIYTPYDSLLIQSIFIFVGKEPVSLWIIITPFNVGWILAVFLEAVSQQDKECNYHFWRLSCGYSSCHGRLQNQVNPLLNGYSDNDHCSSPSLWKIRAAGCAPSSSVLVAAEEHSFSDEDCRELVRECRGTMLWMLGIGRPGDVQGLDNGHGQIRDSCCRLHGKCVVEWVPTKPFKCSLTRSLAWAQQSIGDQILSGDTGSYKVQGWPY